MDIDFLAHIQAESARFAAVLRDTDPAAPVPTCPEWTAADLVWHLAEVQLFWCAIVRDRLTDPGAAGAAEPERPAGYAALLALGQRASTELAAALEGTADDVRVWSWSADESVGFVRRRMAHEALVHRLDAELTVGPASDVDAELATDGVREVLQLVLGGSPAWSVFSPTGPLGRLRTSDTGAEWLVQLGGFSGQSPNSGKTFDHRPVLELVDSGEPAYTVSAPARDLDAWVWNRPTLTDVTVEGDRGAFDALAALIGQGV